MAPIPVSTNAPVESIDTRSKHTSVQEGIALCLSGGGFRAMLFHVGSLWRLNELCYLPKLVRISSVSGGSITSAVMGMNWKKLGFDAQGRVVYDERGHLNRNLRFRVLRTSVPKFVR
jgi:predicted acylesterase/phospholipase RssA